MKERPILFSGAMVRAILNGEKTQTRRVMHPQPSSEWEPSGWGEVHKTNRDGSFAMRRGNPVVIGWGPCNFDGDEAHPCPYGQPGDRLWVRETWRTDDSLDGDSPKSFQAWPVKYSADGAVLRHGAFYGNTDGKLRPSIFMPRWASRIELEILGVRVERLQDISLADCGAEGIVKKFHCENRELWGIFSASHSVPHPRTAYHDLWESVNGLGSWDLNPWVWVVEFKRVNPEAAK